MPYRLFYNPTEIYCLLFISTIPFFCRWSFGVLLWEIESEGKHVLSDKCQNS